MADRLHWERLTREEKATYMRLQMASRGKGSPYLPDDCYDCPACGLPELGSGGLCRNCYSRWRRLRSKLIGEGG